MDETYIRVRFLPSFIFHNITNHTSDGQFDKTNYVDCRYWENEKVRLDYRPVHMNTLDDEIETFPPKARVY